MPKGSVHARLRTAALTGAGLLAAYLVAAYALLPWLWTHHERQAGLAGRPMVTRTAQGIPGDPLNTGLAGSRQDVVRAMHAAGWFPADPVTLRSAEEIVGSVVLDRPYPDAPVSPLFYDGRREDLAFERPAGRSADRRHHVRLWQVLENGAEGRPVWLGSATFDRGVGVSRYTGALTHHIAPDIDAERDALAAGLEAAHMVLSAYDISGIGPTLFGRNGEGDAYHTDGEIRFLELVPDGAPNAGEVVDLPSPPLIEWKNAVWNALAD